MEQSEHQPLASGQAAAARRPDPAPVQAPVAYSVAFEPIVNIHTGACLGMEGALDGMARLGFPDVHAFHDSCHALGVLSAVQAHVHTVAMAGFAGLADSARLKLFLPLDARLLDRPDLEQDLAEALGITGMPPDGLVVQVDERHPLHANSRGLRMLRDLKRRGKIALDGFGAGHGSLPLLHELEPDFVKLDPVFVRGVAGDSRRKALLRHLVNIAHLAGTTVVAKGLEDERDYFLCKEAGCDLVQGPLIQPPTANPVLLRATYDRVDDLARRDRRHRDGDQALILERIERVEPIEIGTDMLAVFEMFRRSKTRTFFPVVDTVGEPVGIVHERLLKDYTYSLYGRELITNKAVGRSLSDFVTRCPMADINTKAEKILEIFSASEDPEGILIVDGGRYCGFLSARQLLKVVNEKNLSLARDMNPLTKLPGNTLIHEYLSEALADTGTEYCIVYFDFDSFKPFNDKYGFRLGDRAITLFADLLKSELESRDGAFVGHVGGDDFFAGFRDWAFERAAADVQTLVQRFRSDAESFYGEDERRAGVMRGKDREGVEREIPLLAVSAALVQLPAIRAASTIEELSGVFASLKKEAKQSPEKTSNATFRPL